MKAVRYIQAGKPPEIVDLPRPEPGPGQVLLRVAAAGVCHSDLHLLDHGRFTNPFTLGHENSGYIAGLGEGVTGFKEGDAVAVYGAWGCGHCHSCQHSAENYCHHLKSPHTIGGGLGEDGGMAEYMIVPSPRQLVSLGKLDPVLAAPLSDAALTPYHAIKAALPWLTPDASVVVVGIGGLGHMAVQILRALTSAQIIACDIDDSKLAHAKALGADHLVSTRDAAAARHAIRALVGERGAAVALDFVGAQPTIDLCASIVGFASRLTIVGLGGGILHYGANKPPYGCEVNVPFWGTRAELMEVIALAEAGRIHSEVERFPLEDAPKVYERLREGKIHGRAVLIP
ncbi:NAD(P)-dependent alcohol dehydrogenase [Acinetobacter courvalinii]|uniref:NAD(P)-dependent alcohol dehydrogenase n=1 Tax=Acinetobacter courvalinii TaxID=280147 RepID=UPI0021D1D079|nr:NAD(P)-dependent alcohol dehydrogenase [Acinetobacter courvalinii]MCU4578780.1 NAD(P)-dependent alcohol dehydrogenase [Acinetobacter courvalinii]